MAHISIRMCHIYGARIFTAGHGARPHQQLRLREREESDGRDAASEEAELPARDQRVGLAERGTAHRAEGSVDEDLKGADSVPVDFPGSH